MDKKLINWQEYRENLVSSLSNERIWSKGCNANHNPHISNIAELEYELERIDANDYDAIVSMHSDTLGYFNSFLLDESNFADNSILLEKLSYRYHKLDYISLDNELCIIFQGIITPLDFDFERIARDWKAAEGNFNSWYNQLSPAEQKRLIDYYKDKHLK